LNPYVVALTYAVVGTTVIAMVFALFKTPYQVWEVVLAAVVWGSAVVHPDDGGNRIVRRDSRSSFLAIGMGTCHRYIRLGRSGTPSHGAGLAGIKSALRQSCRNHRLPCIS
jgi:hypothetical protein